MAAQPRCAPERRGDAAAGCGAALILGHLGFDEWVDARPGSPGCRAAQPSARTAGVSRTPTVADLPGRHQTGRPVQEHHVPVRLGARGDLGRVVRSEQPDRVDLGEPTQGRTDAEHDEEESAGLGGIDREHPLPDSPGPRCGRDPANCVCFCRTTRARWAPMRAAKMAGMSRTWAM